MTRFRSVQGLRTEMAALLVVMVHYGGAFGELEKAGQGRRAWFLTLGNLDIFGSIGVPIFFVISGFVIGLQPFEPGWRGAYDFMARRIAHILPLYWTTTLLVCAYFSIFTQWALDFYDARFNGWRLLGSLTFSTVAAGQMAVVGPGWTWCRRIEAARIVTLGSVLAAAVAIGQALPRNSLLDFFSSPLVLEFLGGLLVSQIYRCRIVARFSLLYVALGIAAAVASATTYANTAAMLVHPSGDPEATAYLLVCVLWFTGGTFLVLGLVTEEEKKRVYLGGTVLQVLGNSSYAIYLLHVPIAAITFHWLLWTWHVQVNFDPHVALAPLIALPAAVALAVHYGFERPVNKAFLALLLRLGPPARQLPQPENCQVEAASGLVSQTN